MSSTPRIIAIEGNIGAGKSVLLNKLRPAFAHRQDVVFVDEPVDEWLSMKDRAGASILQRYYEDPAKHAFSFQMLACLTRLKRLRAALATGAKFIICERSLDTDRHVFAELLHAAGHLSPWEFKIYTDWYDTFSADIPPVAHLYLVADGATCAQRIKGRGREGEDVDPEYLMQCGQAHDSWLRGSGSASLLDQVDSAAGASEVLRRAMACLARVGLDTTSGAPRWVLHFDGAARGNPGPAGWGYWASCDGEPILADCGRLPSAATNNEAEYEAALSGLRALGDYLTTGRSAASSITIRGDSLLVVNQLKGLWACRAPNLLGRYTESLGIVRRLSELLGPSVVIKVEHVPRAKNGKADRLANEGIDSAS